MSRDITVGAVRNRATELGYAVTSATHPDRIVDSRFQYGGNRASWWEIAKHPAAIMCHPDAGICGLEDAPRRRIALLVLTGYLLADARQAKAVVAALGKFHLTGGPSAVDSFGNQIYPLQWNCTEDWNELYGLHARQCFSGDDKTVSLISAVAPQRYERRRVEMGYATVALDPMGSELLHLDREWQRGHILDTPRRDLPELLASDLREIIVDVEDARWGARPAAAARDAA